MGTDPTLIPGILSVPPSGSRFSHLFSPKALQEVFQARFSSSASKGIDRISGFQFRERAREELCIAAEKCLNKTYRFAPYLEKLNTKGRGRYPRVISIPTIRDRVVLHQLKEFLSEAFPDSVPRNIAAAYVQSVRKELLSLYVSKKRSKTLVLSCDVRDFYPSIDRRRLLKALGKTIEDARAMHLVQHAIFTPTIPRNTRSTERERYFEKRGIPQGLSISNILAAIYLSDVDAPMKRLGVSYYRYVDDILIFGADERVRLAHKSLVARLRVRGLGVHPIGKGGKSNFYRLSDSFGFLGYYFSLPHVTVRQNSNEKFLQSICAKITDYKHNKARRLEQHKYLNAERLRQIFLLELNERITGAISEKRRYGWLAYYSSITDLTLLHHLDRAIASLITRVDDFEKRRPAGLKRLSRAYYEIKYRPDAGYIPNYDEINTREEKLRFLVDRGRLAPDERLTDAQIDDRYERYKRHVLATLQPDESTLY